MRVSSPVGKFAIKRARFPALQPNTKYHLTSQTPRCQTGYYQTQVKLSVAGHSYRSSSARTLIDCSEPANNHCDVAAIAPSLSNGRILASGSFKCASDQPFLGWTATLQGMLNGSWQFFGDDGALFDTPSSCWRKSPSCPANDYAAGGRTYDESVALASCAGLPGPGEYRSLFKVQRAQGPAITKTSPTASLNCP